jgi:hypothetical protein
MFLKRSSPVSPASVSRFRLQLSLFPILSGRLCYAFLRRHGAFSHAIEIGAVGFYLNFDSGVSSLVGLFGLNQFLMRCCLVLFLSYRLADSRFDRPSYRGLQIQSWRDENYRVNAVAGIRTVCLL